MSPLPDLIELDLPTPAEPFPLIRASDLTAQPVKINWLINNILERGSLNLLFGEPGAGKSLFALDWAFCITTGMDWHGHKTKKTDVIIVAGEGFAGLGRRLKALEVKYDRKSSNNLFISQRPAQLMDSNNAQWVADSIKAICPNPGLVIIDTLHRNIDGDENSSQDIGKFVSNLDVFLKPMGAAVLVVHHSGHGQKDRSRGSSAIRAAMDGEFSASKADGGITLSCHKAKDFEAFIPMQFSIKPTDIGWMDDDNEAMTSVYLFPSGDTKPKNDKPKLSAREDSILTCLHEAIAENGIAPTNEIKNKFAGFSSLAGQMQKIVLIEKWRDKAYSAISSDQNKRQTFWRARNKFMDKKLTVEHGDFVWIWPD